jgi:hypothetical protein
MRSSELAEAVFRAGAAEAVITPPVGIHLEGYTPMPRSNAVHDDLHARALVVDDGTTQAAVVSCDLIGVNRALSQNVRSAVHAATGIPAAHVMVSATHTHMGPAILLPDPNDPPVADVLAQQIAGAVVRAHASIQPAVLKAGRGTVDSVSQNRRHPDWPIDDHLAVLLFDTPDPRDTPIAAVMNFACHATIMYRTNHEISADYPGHAARTAKSLLGGAPALFLQGACGDVNPAWIEQRFEEAERVGTIVGAEAARRLQEMRPLGAQHKVWSIRWDELTDKPISTGDLLQPRVRVASREVDVRIRALEAPERYDEELTALRAKLDGVGPEDVGGRRALMERITFLQGTSAMARVLRPNTLKAEVQAISFAPGQAIVALPGEFFAATGREIRGAAGIPHPMIACYSNHHLMYVVPRHAWDQGGYEPGVSILDEDAEENIRAAAIDAMREAAS